jgi:hypothetical protein
MSEGGKQMISVRTTLGIVAIIAALSGAACGGSTGEAPQTTATTSAAPASTEGAKPTCDAASQVLIDAIMTGAANDAGMKAIKGVTWKSPDYEKVWFVGIRFSATGVEDQTMVHATNSLVPGDGLILSVDGNAQQFTDWGAAKDTDAKISPADRGVDVVRACLR